MQTEWIFLLFCDGGPRRSAESDKWATGQKRFGTTSPKPKPRRQTVYENVGGFD